MYDSACALIRQHDSQLESSSGVLMGHMDAFQEKQLIERVEFEVTRTLPFCLAIKTGLEVRALMRNTTLMHTAP